jgi:2-polyprenyl-6-methoxyphenol hydroxylase-like FAD-dependent oxidoreductase
MQNLSTRCVIAGGGPAGIMLGYLLARGGIEVVVLEKWPDFFRDFRGDTIHPSTMENLHELGLLEKFLKLPHQKTRQMVGRVGGEEVVLADLSWLHAREPYIAFLPQWDFLNFLSGEAKRFPSFKILMETDAIDLIYDPVVGLATSPQASEHGKIAGIKAKNKEGEFEIRAELVVGADGRHSTIREKSGLTSISTGVPIDVLWFRLSARESDPEQSFGFIDEGKALVTLDRGDYWQCGFIIAKGDFEHIKSGGLEKFRMTIARLAPHLSASVSEIRDWDQVKFLSVTIDHLEKWYKPGLLMIGDAAHAMSPLGGVGINVAIQDAIAAGNILVPAFKKGTPNEADCAAIQKRRWFSVRLIQRLQVFMQDKFLEPYLHTQSRITKLPWMLKVFQHLPFLRYIPARIVGIGFRPEHVQTDAEGLA